MEIEINLDRFLIWDKIILKFNWLKIEKIVAFNWKEKVLIDMVKRVF